MFFPKKILVVEPTPKTTTALQTLVDTMKVEYIASVQTEAKAKEIIFQESFDMILIDTEINPQDYGVTLAKSIIEHLHLPIIFIDEGKSMERIDRLLEVDSYGCLFQPFSLKKLHFTIKLAYKRYSDDKARFEKHHQRLKEKEVITISQKYAYHLEEKRLYAYGKPISLHYQQNKVIEILVRHLNQTVSKEQFVCEIWSPEKEMVNSALRTLIYRIRKNLPDLPLISYSKVGYALKPIQDVA